jgi:hypothetical protein
LTAPKLYRVPDSDNRLYAVEEDGNINWTKFSEDHAVIANLKRSTKHEFEMMRFNEGYVDDVNTLFTKVGNKIHLKK